MLHSALSRPKPHASYADDVDIIFLAALDTTAIIREDPLVDRNKRTGFVLGIQFLELNGYRFFAPEDVAAHAILSLTEGKRDEIAYTQFLRDFSSLI